MLCVVLCGVVRCGVVCCGCCCCVVVVVFVLLCVVVVVVLCCVLCVVVCCCVLLCVVVVDAWLCQYSRQLSRALQMDALRNWAQQDPEARKWVHSSIDCPLPMRLRGSQRRAMTGDQVVETVDSFCYGKLDVDGSQCGTELFFVCC